MHSVWAYRPAISNQWPADSCPWCSTSLHSCNGTWQKVLPFSVYIYASVVSWSQHILIYIWVRNLKMFIQYPRIGTCHTCGSTTVRTQEPNHQSNRSGKQRVVMNILTSWCQITQCFSRCPHFVLHGQSFAAPWGWVTIAGYVYFSSTLRNGREGSFLHSVFRHVQKPKLCHLLQDSHQFTWTNL